VRFRGGSFDPLSVRGIWAGVRSLWCFVCLGSFFFRATWPGVLYLGMCRTVARSVDDGSRYDRTEEIVMVSGGSFYSVSILSLVAYFG